MARYQTNEVLVHGENIKITYETTFGKILRSINMMNYKAAMPLVVCIIGAYLVFAAIGMNFFVLFSLFSFIWFILWFIKNVYEPVYGDHAKIGMINEKNPKKKKYFLHLGDAVRSIRDIPNPAIVKKETPEQLQYPIMIDFDMALRHMFAVGTTGSGKTTFSVNLLRQHLGIGGGGIIVDGKGDKDIYTDIMNTCIAFNREDDMSVINFNLPSESNKMNPLLTGSVDDISNMLGNLVESGGDNAIWAGRAMSMMNALLSCLLPLRDSSELYDPIRVSSQYKKDYDDKKYVLPKAMSKHMDGTDVYQPIFTFKVLSKFLDLEAIRALYYRTMDRNELIKSDNYEGTGVKEEVDLARMRMYLVSCSVPIGPEQRNEAIPEGGTKMHSNSNVMWNEALDLFAGAYGDIFNTEFPNMTMNDVVYNSRFLYVLLPATKKDPRTLSMLGKVILALLKQSVASLLGEKISGNIEERRAASAIKPVIPFIVICDEYGAYAVSGFDNILAQARSLSVSVMIEVQEIASLEKTGEIDKKRLLGNTAIKVVLKVEDLSTAEELAKMIGTEKRADVQYGGEGQQNKNYNVSERNIVEARELAQMKGGHGYVRFSGETTAMLAGFYKPPNARYIQEFNSFTTLTTQNYALDTKVDELRKVGEVLDKYNIFVENNVNTKKYDEFIDNQDENDELINVLKSEQSRMNEILNNMANSPINNYRSLLDTTEEVKNSLYDFIKVNRETLSAMNDKKNNRRANA